MVFLQSSSDAIAIVPRLAIEFYRLSRSFETYFWPGRTEPGAYWGVGAKPHDKPGRTGHRNLNVTKRRKHRKIGTTHSGTRSHDLCRSGALRTSELQVVRVPTSLTMLNACYKSRIRKNSSCDISLNSSCENSEVYYLRNTGTSEKKLI